jgi:hypothetical protein
VSVLSRATSRQGRIVCHACEAKASPFRSFHDGVRHAKRRHPNRLCPTGSMRLRFDGTAHGFRVLVTENLTPKLVAQFADANEAPGDLDTTIRVRDHRERTE